MKQCSGAKWMMKSAPRYCHSSFAFHFLPGSCIVHTCVSHFKKSSFEASSVYKCLKRFIQPFLGRTSIRMQRKCVNSADNVCYICGEVTFSSQKRAITSIIRKAYHPYFGCQIGDQDKSWAPHICCSTYLCSKPSRVVEPQKAINAFCHTHGVERADESYQ
jgi:hypothetical protein